MRFRENLNAETATAIEQTWRLHIQKVMVVLGTAMLLTACEHNGASITPVATEPDIVTAKLEQAADKASRALDSIANIEQARGPVSPPVENFSDAPMNLSQPITIRWSGPIEQISKA